MGRLPTTNHLPLTTDQVQASASAASLAKYVRIISAPARRIEVSDSIMARSRSSHPLRAAASGAWLHGRASTLGPRRGLVASDLLDCLPAVFDDLEA